MKEKEAREDSMKCHSPMDMGREFFTLSPIVESVRGSEIASSPAFAGEVPKDNLGILDEEESR